MTLASGRVIDSITKVQDVTSRVVERGQLKKGKNVKSKVDVANIVCGKRGRERSKKEIAIQRPPKKMKVKDKGSRAKFGMKPEDAVSVAPEIFDGKVPGSFSKGNPKRQDGIVKRVWAGKRKLHKSNG